MSKNTIEKGAERIGDVLNDLDATGTDYTSFTFLSDGKNVFIQGNAGPIDLALIVNQFMQYMARPDETLVRKEH